MILAGEEMDPTISAILIFIPEEFRGLEEETQMICLPNQSKTQFESLFMALKAVQHGTIESEQDVLLRKPFISHWHDYGVKYSYR